MGSRINSKSNSGIQWQQNEQAPPPNQQSQIPQPQQQPAYTLPGVINYLTSEFTNLERFKIMSNLEKSEMKYKIVQLQGELNALKFTNSKQKKRIEQLENENAALRNGDNPVPDTQKDMLELIPDIDLLVIKQSRTQLTKSMKEIVLLLKVPTYKSANYLNLPPENENDMDILLDHSETPVSLPDTHPTHTKKSPLTAHYFEDDVNIDQIDFKSQDFATDFQFEELKGSRVDEVDLSSFPVESDAETEIFDHFELHEESRKFVYTSAQRELHIDAGKFHFLVSVFESEKTIFSRKFPVSDFKEIELVYPISFNTEDISILVVHDAGSVSTIFLKDDVLQKLEFSLNIPLVSSGWAEFVPNTSFGLVLNTKPQVHVYRIDFTPNGIEHREIAAFSHDQLVTSTDSLEFVKWNHVDKTANDPLLAYQPVYQVKKKDETGVLTLNLATKQPNYQKSTTV